MPRPVRERRILEVAGEVFSGRGYHAASMEEIAERAGVTKPVVYAYFSSKEGLYVAYIERQGEALLDRMRAAADPSAAPAKRLEAGILQFLRFVGEHREGWQVLQAEATARGGPLAEEIAGLRARIVRMVSRLLEQETRTRRRAGSATALDGVAHALVGAGESLANWWLTQGDVPPGKVVGWLVALARAGVEQAR